MNWFLQTLNSSLGKKFVMAITGLFLITFLVVHCGVNALIFLGDDGEIFNKAGHFMGTNWLIRTMEVVLFLGLILHIVQSLSVTRFNQKARPVGYAVTNAAANSKWYSRSMGLLGTLILMFLIIHLSHFWVDSRFTDEIPERNGVMDLYSEMKAEFSQLWVVILYVLAMISLGYHLLHGFSSAFQTLGLNHKKYTPFIQAVGFWYSIIISLVFAAMPVYVYLITQ